MLPHDTVVAVAVVVLVAVIIVVVVVVTKAVRTAQIHLIGIIKNIQ